MKKILLLLLIPFFSYAQNINDVLRLANPWQQSGVRALGMGNMYNSLSDDGSGIMYNPAGIAFVRRMEMSIGMDYYRHSNATTFFNNETDYSNSETNFSQMSFLFPFPTIQGSLVFGINYSVSNPLTGALSFNGFNDGNTSRIQALNSSTYIPYDLFLTDTVIDPVTNDYRIYLAGKLNQSGTTIETGAVQSFGFSVASEIQPNLMLGATLNIISGEYKFSRDYYEDDTQGFYNTFELAPGVSRTSDFESFYLSQVKDWDISGWDLKLGMIYQLQSIARFSMKIQLPKSITIKESFSASGYAEWGNGQRDELDEEAYSDNAEFEITTPFEFTLGGVLSAYDFIIGAEVDFTDYTQAEFDGSSSYTPTYIANLNKDIKDELSLVINYKAGVEYYIPYTDMRIRLGYYSNKSPYADDPAEYTKKYYTAGLGILLDKSISVDMAAVLGSWKTFGDNYGENDSRTFQEITATRVLLNVGYRF